MEARRDLVVVRGPNFEVGVSCSEIEGLFMVVDEYNGVGNLSLVVEMV